MIGRSFAQDEVAGVIEQIIAVYVENRQPGERFIDVVDRIGIEPFKTRVYAKETARV